MLVFSLPKNTPRRKIKIMIYIYILRFHFQVNTYVHLVFIKPSTIYIVLLFCSLNFTRARERLSERRETQRITFTSLT